MAEKEEAQKLARVPAPRQFKNVSLFCFEVVVAAESHLVEIARFSNMGIFGCDDFMVIEGQWSGKGKGGGNDQTASWTNVDAFLAAWHQVGEDGRFKDHDWVVKVDPDAVFVPKTLRQWLVGRPPPETGAYLTACQGCALHNGFYGAMEVLSRVAAQRYVDSADRCKAVYSGEVGGWGEDLFAQRCMDFSGVTCWDQDVHELVCDQLCGCWDGCAPGRAAYHPYKDANQFQDCMNSALQ